MNKLFAGVCLAACAGCATVPDNRLSFEQEAQRWVGHPDTELIAARGTPTKTITHGYDDGTLIDKTLEYSGASALNKPAPGAAMLRPVLANGQWVMMPDESVRDGGKKPIDCKLVFKTDKASIVRSWSSEGKDCR